MPSYYWCPFPAARTTDTYTKETSDWAQRTGATPVVNGDFSGIGDLDELLIIAHGHPIHAHLVMASASASKKEADSKTHNDIANELRQGRLPPSHVYIECLMCHGAGSYDVKTGAQYGVKADLTSPWASGSGLPLSKAGYYQDIYGAKELFFIRLLALALNADGQSQYPSIRIGGFANAVNNPSNPKDLNRVDFMTSVVTDINPNIRNNLPGYRTLGDKKIAPTSLGWVDAQGNWIDPDTGQPTTAPSLV
jgi:hypothetical protein